MFSCEIEMIQMNIFNIEFSAWKCRVSSTDRECVEKCQRGTTAMTLEALINITTLSVITFNCFDLLDFGKQH